MAKRDMAKRSSAETAAVAEIADDGPAPGEDAPHAKAEAGWRGSREVWLQAAYESLLESGVEAVRIQPLGKKINLSRTSFYWFFEDREELLSGLVSLWREKNTEGLLRQAGAYSESLVEAILNVFDCWINPTIFDSQFEQAIRSWALQSPDVAREILAADTIRLDALRSMFGRYGIDELSADVRARSVYLTQIGYISMQTKENLAVQMRRIPKYVEIFSGQMPQPQELARFFARNNYEVAEPAPRDRRRGPRRTETGPAAAKG